MKQFLFILAAIALIGQFNHAVAQTAATQGQTPDQFFETIIRSSAVDTLMPLLVSPYTGRRKTADPTEIKRCCEKIKKDIQRVYFLQDRNGKMKLQIRGVYTHGASLFFCIQLRNHSPLDYDVDSVRFLVTAAGRNKDPSRVPGTLHPIYVSDSAAVVEGHSSVLSVFVLPRFTLSAGEQLTVNVLEKNGGRQLRVRATNLTLERARLI